MENEKEILLRLSEGDEKAFRHIFRQIISGKNTPEDKKHSILSISVTGSGNRRKKWIFCNMTACWKHVP
jgi:hypothetical protein